MKIAAIRPGEDLEKAYKRLSKQADQRLVRLEAASHEKGYEGILTYSYGLAMKNIATYSGEGATRFNTAAPKDRRTLQAKVNDIIQFLNSPTSTKSGVTAIYKKRTDELNKKYGTNFTWQEAGRFFESKKDDFNKNWDSGLVLKSIGKMQKEASRIKKDLEAHADRHKTVSEKDINDEIYKRLKKNGITAASLLDKDAFGSDPFGNDPFGADEGKKDKAAKKTKTRKKDRRRSRLKRKTKKGKR